MTASYWQSHEVPPSPALEGEERCDIAIVGGGLAGLALGYWLAQQSDASTTLLEGRRIGQGASGRNGGLVLAGIDAYQHTLEQSLGVDEATRLWRFTEANRESLLAFIAEEAIECEVTRDGSYRLATYPNELELLKLSHKAMALQGIACEYLEPDEIAQRLGGAEFKGGVSLPEDARLHSVKLLAGLAEAGRRRGLAIRERSQVLDMAITESGQVRLVTESGALTAEMCVVAANAMLPLLMPEHRNLVAPRRGQMLAYAPTPEIQMPGGHYAEYGFVYWQQRPDGRILAGGMRHHAMEEEIGYDELPTEFVQGRLETWMTTHFPQLQDVPVERRWAGIMGFSADGLPMIGPLPGKGALHLLCGFSGHGLGMAFECARRHATLLLEGGEPTFPRMFSTRSKHRESLFFDD